MATCRTAYRFRMKPTKIQEQALLGMAGARRFVWNWGLARKKAFYEETGDNLSYGKLAAELTVLKQQPETSWLKGADSQSLQQALKDLDEAYRNFFNPEMKARFPKFKSRKKDQDRFRIPQRVKVEDNYVIVPKIGKIKLYLSQSVDLETKSATFKKDSSGKWFVSLIAEFDMPDVAIPIPHPSQVIGIDLGLKDFIVTSENSRVLAPRFFRKGQSKLRKAQRVFSRRQKGSNRRSKARLVFTKIHQHIKDQRNDFLHKLSTELVSKHPGICIEDLCLIGLAKTKLAKSIYDASFGEFRRQLEYKTLWARTHLVVIDRFFPSSKLHRECGEINNDLTLSDRIWKCGCGKVVDRDLNAALNIKDEGLRILTAGHADK